MGNTSVNTELVLAALLEQHRWEFNCEALYRKGLGSDTIDEACLDDMLRTFGIARNLSGGGRKVLLDQLPNIAKLHKKTPQDWKSIFQVTADIKGPEPFFIQGSQTKQKTSRRFVSGLTKVLWFAGAHQMPMFDSLTCNAVKPRGTSTTEKAIGFYQDLHTKWDYGSAFNRLEAVGKAHMTNWHFAPERFIDKLLLIKGLTKQNFENSFLMGKHDRRINYLELLSETSRNELNNFVGPLCGALESTVFYARLPK